MTADSAQRLSEAAGQPTLGDLAALVMSRFTPTVQADIVLAGERVTS